jgi:hypothetical protein
MVQSFLLGSNDYAENNKAELSEYIHANAYNDALSTLEARSLGVVLFQEQALGRDPSTGELRNPKLGALLSLSGVLWGFNVLKFDQSGEEVQSEDDILNALVRNFREQEEAIRVLHATRRYLFAEPENKKGEDLTAITEFNLFIEVSPASSRSPSRWYSVFPDSAAIPHGYRVEPDLKWNEAKASVIQNSSPDVSLYVAAKTFFPRGDAAERDAVKEAMARTAEQSAAVAITSGRRLQAGATIDLSRDTPRVARTGLLGAGTMMQAQSTAPKLPFPLRYMGLYDRFDSPTMMIGNIITGKYRTTKVLRLSEEKQKTLLSLWMRRACDHMNAGVLTWADIQAIYGYGRDNLLSVIEKAFRLRALTPEAFCRLAGDSTPPMPTAPRRDMTPKTERPAAPKLGLSILKRQ